MGNLNRRFKKVLPYVVMAILIAIGMKNAPAKERQLILISKEVKPRLLISPASPAAEKFAARELADYLEKIAGQKIVIEAAMKNPVGSSKEPLIILGSHPLNSALARQISTMEETIIEAKPGVLHLVGGRPQITDLPNGTRYVEDRGALYAVYEFLDELGVRWYRPEAWGEHVPHVQSLSIALGRRQYKPVYSWRQALAGYRYRSDQTPEQAQLASQWSVRNRQNSNVPNLSEEQGRTRLVQTWHNVSNIFPPDKYFKTHPEYRALIDGVRRKDGQLCLGNPEVQAITVEKVLEFAKSNPHYITFSLEPEDNSLWCQCELCKAMDDPAQKLINTEPSLLGGTRPMGDVSMSNRVNLFGKIVAEKVAQSNKKIKILWLAYSLHTEVPSLVQDLPENVVVMPAAFTSAFSRDRQYSYSDYSRDLFDPQSRPNRNFVRVLNGYGKLTRILTYEYWSGIAWVGPMPLIRTMKDRLQSYRKFPIDGMYHEMHPHWGPQGIDQYFFMRLLWNPDLDIEKELDLYCKNYYGPAYKPMLEYHTLLEDAAHAGIPHYSYGIGTHAIFTPGVIKRMGELIQESKKLIGDKEPYKQRFEGVWAGYEYTRLVTPYFEFLAKGDKLEAAKHWERANKLILSYKNGEVFDNGVLFGSLQFFGNYNLNIPADIQKQAKEFIAKETSTTQ